MSLQLYASHLCETSYIALRAGFVTENLKFLIFPARIGWFRDDSEGIKAESL